MNNPLDQTPRSSSTSLNSLVLWNISKAQEKNPKIDLKSALERIREQLAVNNGGMSLLLDEPQEMRHLLCALLAWQHLGHNDIDSLVYFSELRNKMMEEQKEERSKENLPSKCSAMKSSLMGPVINLPVRVTKAASPFKLPIPSVAAPHATFPVNTSDMIKKFQASCCLKPEYASLLEKSAAATTDMKERVQRLQQRESRRVELLERAELAWQNLEQGFKRKLQLATEKEKIMAERLNDTLKDLHQYEIQKSKLDNELSRVTQEHETEVENTTHVEKCLCEVAVTRHLLSEEAAAKATCLTDQQCKNSKKETELKFKEDAMKSKVNNLKNDLESARLLTFEAERVIFNELKEIKSQIEEQSQQLLQINAKNREENDKVNHYKQHKLDLENDLTNCKSHCDKHMEDGMAKLRALREQLGGLREQAADCRCKLPVDVTLQIKRTASLVACDCTSAAASDTNCSCTSLRRKLYSDLLSDLFGGLQNELTRNGCTMPCEILKCLDEKHNWERSPAMKFQLRAFFSQLLVGELDIAIATSIEKYHAKWVGRNCKDPKNETKKSDSKMSPQSNNECGCTCVEEPDPEAHQNIEVERRAMQLIEMMFREQAYKFHECNKNTASKKVSSASFVPKDSTPDTRVFSCQLNNKKNMKKMVSATMRQRATDTGMPLNHIVPKKERKTNIHTNTELKNEKKTTKSWNRDYDCYNIKDLKRFGKDVWVGENQTLKNIGAKTAVKNTNVKDVNTVTSKLNRNAHKLNIEKKQLFESCPPKKTTKNAQTIKNYKKHLTTFDIHTFYETQLNKPSLVQSDERQLTQQESFDISAQESNLTKNGFNNLNKSSNSTYQDTTCSSNTPCFHKQPSQSSLNKLLKLLNENQSKEKFISNCDQPNEILDQEVHEIVPEASILSSKSLKDRTESHRSNSKETFPENHQNCTKYDGQQNSDDAIFLENKVTKDVDLIIYKPDRNIFSCDNYSVISRNTTQKTCISVLGNVNLVTANHDLENRFNNKGILNNLKATDPVNVQAQESEYMGEINLDRSYETCDCKDDFHSGNKYSFKCINSIECKCKNAFSKDKNSQECSFEPSGLENQTVMMKNLADNTTQTTTKTVDFVYSSIMSNDDNEKKIANQSMEPGKVIEQTIHDILKKSEPIHLSADYDINFLGVTLNDLNFKSINKNLENDIPISAVLNDESKIPILRKDYVCKSTELGTDSQKMQSIGVNDVKDDKQFLSNYLTKFCETNRSNGNKALDSPSIREIALPPSFLEKFPSVDCVCCTAKNHEEFKDLEVNAYALLWEHLKGKLEELKTRPHNKTFLTTEEENNLFSSILQKVKKVISESTKKVTCTCQVETELEGNWKRAQTLLQEYLRTKIQRVKCSCFSNMSGEEIYSSIPELLDKVSTMIENDFERLNTCELKNVNEIKIPDKNKSENSKQLDYSTSKNASTGTDDTHLKIMCKNKSDETDAIIIKTTSCQVSRNFTKHSKSCETDKTKESPINVITKTQPLDKIDNSYTKVTVIGANQNTSTFDDDYSKYHSFDPPISLKLIENAKDQTLMPLKVPYMGCTVDCSCDVTYSIGTCVCTKSILNDNNIRTLYKHSSNNIGNINYEIPCRERSVNDEVEKVTRSMPLINIDSNDSDYNSKMTVTKKPTKHVIISGNEYSLHNSVKNEEPYQIASVTKLGNEDENKSEYPSSCNKDDNLKCDCKTVPICHVKMLVDDIENRLARSNCICDSFNPIVCPVHACK